MHPLSFGPFMDVRVSGLSVLRGHAPVPYMQHDTHDKLPFVCCLRSAKRSWAVHQVQSTCAPTKARQFLADRVLPRLVQYRSGKLYLVSHPTESCCVWAVAQACEPRSVASSAKTMASMSRSQSSSPTKGPQYQMQSLSQQAQGQASSRHQGISAHSHMC